MKTLLFTLSTTALVLNAALAANQAPAAKGAEVGELEAFPSADGCYQIADPNKDFRDVRLDPNCRLDSWIYALAKNNLEPAKPGQDAPSCEFDFDGDTGRINVYIMCKPDCAADVTDEILFLGGRSEIAPLPNAPANLAPQRLRCAISPKSLAQAARINGILFIYNEHRPKPEFHLRNHLERLRMKRAPLCPGLRPPIPGKPHGGPIEVEREDC